jgi:hypothetical protein
MNGETWLVPAIGIDWSDDGADRFEASAVRCRACGLSWDLADLIHGILDVNATRETLAV